MDNGYVQLLTHILNKYVVQWTMTFFSAFRNEIN